MNNAYIYSYRLTHFGGTAPCYDGDYLSLAICKRDMRRVIGYRFNEIKNKAQNDSIWIVGISGTQLSKNNKYFTADRIIYIAKITDVKTFCEYFSDVSEKRKDKIYIPDNNGFYETNNMKFSTKPNNEVHDDKHLWDRDWDVQHKFKEKFVLISTEYAFTSKEQSDCLISEFQKFGKYKLAKTVGHTWFECNDSSNIISAFNKILKSSQNHNKRFLPENLKNGFCGKDKGI